MIKGRRNHPSIIQWDVFNEARKQRPFLRQFVLKAENLPRQARDKHSVVRKVDHKGTAVCLQSVSAAAMPLRWVLTLAVGLVWVVTPGEGT